MNFQPLGDTGFLKVKEKEKVKGTNYLGQVADIWKWSLYIRRLKALAILATFLKSLKFSSAHSYHAMFHDFLDCKLRD